MSAQNFDQALRCILREEGGYTNDPVDPGGPTNWGITLADARRYWKANASASDVRAMPVDVAKLIYRRHYWDTLRCDALPDGIDIVIMDYGVNSGVARAAKVLRRVLGLNDAAPFTELEAALSRTRNARVIDAICDERLRFLRGLNTFWRFGNGWTARVARVRAAGHALAARAPVKIDPPALWERRTQSPGKGQAPLDTKQVAASTGGALVVGGAAAGHAAQSGASLALIFAIVLIAIAAAAAAFAFWRWRQRRRQQAPV